ncbi:MAG: alpha/beta hydrolase [Lewinellaceae bacterium]|nr:alpha/beta hydrolase [Lewinellaceae bacterium]
MKRLVNFLFLLLITQPVFTQQYVTANQYSYSVQKDLVYGTAVNYTGATDTLKLDLYKPIGDNNPSRPLAVLVHGGSWLTGCKTDVAWLAKELAGRGYAVAAVNYRLGWHKAAAVTAACGTQDFPDVFPNEYNALYAADSLEIIRAIYRGQQDVKGAIRWLKARHAQDSTAANAVLVGGESAGAFISLAVGFLDRPEEKPDACLDIPAAPAPSPNTLNLTTLDCIAKVWMPDATARQRPDLGPVDGTLNTTLGYNAAVVGVIDLFGAVPAIGLAQNWIEGPNQPAVYLYHQSCDAVVPSGYGQPFYPYSGICNTYANFSPWHQYTPHVYGSVAISAYLASLPNPPLYETEIVACDPFNSDLGILACIFFANNGGFHFVANKPLTSQKIANFFCPVITGILGGSCTTSAVEPIAGNDLYLAPNPFFSDLILYCPAAPQQPCQIRLTEPSGKTVWSGSRMLSVGANHILSADFLPPGLYFLQIWDGEKLKALKAVRQ